MSLPSSSLCQRSRRLLVGLTRSLIVVGLWASAAPALAGSAAEESDFYRAGQWEYGFESAYTLRNIPFPTDWAVPNHSRNPVDYKFVTEVLSIRYRLTNSNGPWIFRGSLAASASLVGTAIVVGPESYYGGFALGLHYDFVQPRARVVPYFELRGGPGFADSRGQIHTQQQDLTFTYLLGAGLRYDVNRHWTVTIGALDQHLSNFYLAEHNYGVDSLGVNIGVLRRF